MTAAAVDAVPLQAPPYATLKKCEEEGCEWRMRNEGLPLLPLPISMATLAAPLCPHQLPLEILPGFGCGVHLQPLYPSCDCCCCTMPASCFRLEQTEHCAAAWSRKRSVWEFEKSGIAASAAAADHHRHYGGWQVMRSAH
jgi:hypothetical protein